MENGITEIERMARLVSQHEDYRVIRRLVPQIEFAPEPASEFCGRGILLDTETTGRDASKDKIIELGMVEFSFDRRDGQICRVLRTFNELEDPGMSIPPEASAVNGITDEMVTGKHINDDEVTEMVLNADIIIAHNSAFDREFCEERFPIFKSKPWGCSLAQVDWAAEGIGSQKLDYIAYVLGFFYDAHRAYVDCLALLEVLRHPLFESGKSGLKQVLDAYQKDELVVWAVGSPFESKDVLKGNGYRWGDGTNGKEKAWYKPVSGEDYEAEVAWLRANVYANRAFSLVVDRIDAFSRFSTRRTNKETRRH